MKDAPSMKWNRLPGVPVPEKDEGPLMGLLKEPLGAQNDRPGIRSPAH
jgi:hypothetical protein